MAKPNQRDLVYEIVTTKLGDRFVKGETIAEDALTRDDKYSIIADIHNAFMNDTVQVSSEWMQNKNPLQVLGYSKSLLNNWLRKDTRLNGRQSYTPSRGRPLSKAQGDIVYNPTPSRVNPDRPNQVVNPFMGRLGEEPRLKSEICDCGAKHTSNSNLHTDWCSTQH